MKQKMYSFKRLFLSLFFAQVPFLLLGSILILFNIIPITVNKKEYYGVEGFLYCILSGLFMSLVFTIINWIYLNLGNFIYLQTLKMFGRKIDE